MAIRGKLTFPGDKSISHRALMLASLANGISRIKNLSTGKDVQSTRECLSLCGIDFQDQGSTLLVHGKSLETPLTDLNCGNSGTTARLFIGLLAGQGIPAKLVGDSSLSQRPMKRVIDPLTEMGAKIIRDQDRLPITLSSAKLHGIHYTPSIASAQVKSAVLLAGLGAREKTTFSEPVKTRDHTEKMLSEMLADIHISGNQISVSPLQNKLSPFEMSVPGDPSTAAFFAAAAAMSPGSEITLESISVNPTRIGFFNALKQMGGDVEIFNERLENGEPCGDIRVKYQKLKGITVTNEIIPGIIDELPILAVLATQANGVSEVSGAEELRVKECDRIHAVCSNLKAMGADITERQDGFRICGPTKLHGAAINTFTDHRIAMAFTIAGLVTADDVTLDDKSCVEISYPQFFTVLESVLVSND